MKKGLINIKQLFNFPDEFPYVITGVLFPNDGILVTGHQNGYLMKWNIDTKKGERLFECGSPIETISTSPNDDILVGCNSGLIFSFPLSSPENKMVLQEPEYSKFSRVWRSVWPTKNKILTTSTYGGLHFFNKNNSRWEVTSLRGHSDSIFAISAQNGKSLVTGDYYGRIIVWEFRDDTYQEIDNLKVQSKVQGIAWIKNDSFATVDALGRINVFEFELETNQWKSVFEADVATSVGTSINVTSDGKTIFAGSHTEIIQFDLETQVFQTIDLDNSIKIFSKENTIYVLTKNGLSTFERTEIEVPAKHVRYQYAKTSLLGHTGVGKSTLCNILTGSVEKTESTFGKRVWTWTIRQNDNNGPEERIIFHDHGGQKAVLGTFLPFLADSDIILILFSQIDNTTFEQAYEILQQLKSTTNKRTKFFLVQTFIDQKMMDVDANAIEALKKSNQVIDCLKVSLSTKEGLDTFKKRLISEISWMNSKTMIQSHYVIGLMDTISSLEKSNATIVSFNNLKKQYKETTGFEIPTNHLQFLLKSFTSQGIIEYYSELNSIIFNDDEYNKLKSTIPILVDHNNGIITIKKIQDASNNSKYVHILDNLFLNYNLAIQHEDLRIFPEYLKSTPLQINEPFKSLLGKNAMRKEMYFAFQRVDLTNLIKALTELKLNCIDISKTEGVFSWITNACIYYSILPDGDDISGRRIKVKYIIGGKKELLCDRLDTDFQIILTRILGSPV